MKFPVGVQLWSVRDMCEKDLPGTFKKLKEIGYDAVEPYSLCGHTAEEFRKIADDAGLKIFSIHASVFAYEDPNAGGFDKLAETYAKLGIEYNVFPFLGDNRLPGNPEFYETVISLPKIKDACAKHGIEIAFHNHQSEFEPLGADSTRIDKLYESFPYLNAQFDLCWLTCAGFNPVEYIEKYSGRVPLVHMKEVAFEGAPSMNVRKALGIECDCAEESAFVFQPCGKGLMPFEDIMAALEKAGTKYLIVEQDEATPGRDIFDTLGETVQYLKSLMN